MGCKLGQTPAAVSFVYRAQGMYNLTVEDTHTYSVGDGQ